MLLAGSAAPSMQRFFDSAPSQAAAFHDQWRRACGQRRADTPGQWPEHSFWWPLQPAIPSGLGRLGLSDLALAIGLLLLICHGRSIGHPDSQQEPSVVTTGFYRTASRGLG